jgi:hypothetical protein
MSACFDAKLHDVFFAGNQSCHISRLAAAWMEDRAGKLSGDSTKKPYCAAE